MGHPTRVLGLENRQRKPHALHKLSGWVHKRAAYGYQHKPPLPYTVNTRCEYKVVTYPVSRGRRNGFISVIFGYTRTNIHSIFCAGSTVSRSRSGIRHMILSPLRFDPFPNLPYLRLDLRSRFFRCALSRTTLSRE